MNKKTRAGLAAAAISLLALTGCSTAATTASDGLSVAADNFEIQRRIVFFNGITDTYMFTVEGRCSILDEGHQLEVICKTSDTEYKKHFLGLSDNVTYFAEQIDAAEVDPYHYRIIFRPETLVPSIEVDTSAP